VFILLLLIGWLFILAPRTHTHFLEIVLLMHGSFEGIEWLHNIIFSMSIRVHTATISRMVIHSCATYPHRPIRIRQAHAQLLTGDRVVLL